MIGKQIIWSGNLSNDPKWGEVVDERSGNLVIRWGDGSQIVVPNFVITERHGWQVL